MMTRHAPISNVAQDTYDKENVTLFLKIFGGNRRKNKNRVSPATSWFIFGCEFQLINNYLTYSSYIHAKSICKAPHDKKMQQNFTEAQADIFSPVFKTSTTKVV